MRSPCYRARFATLLTPTLLVLLSAQVSRADTIAVPVGGNVQAAIDAAKCGDTITLIAEAAYIGNFRLRNKGCMATTAITVTTQGFSVPAGQRVTPANDTAMARLLAPGNGDPVLGTDAGAGHYKFIGIYFSVNYGTDPAKKYHSSFLIDISNGDDANPSYGKWLSHDITFDRCHIAGKFGDARFAFAVSGFNLTVTNSRIDEFANPPGNDSAAFYFWNAPGHRLENNYISAGMWNLMFGGADSDSPSRAKVVNSTLTSATLAEFEGVRPAIGDLVSFYIRPLGGVSTWQPNTSYPVGTLQFHHSAWTTEVGKPPLLFYIVQGGTSGTVEPDWNSFDEYHNQVKPDGSAKWRLFNGNFQVGKVTAVSGDSITFEAFGGSGIFLPPVVGSIAKWNGYSPSLISRRNHYHRPAHWKPFNAPDKGMIQIKNATDVSFEGDMFTSDAQWPGLMSLTPGNQAYSAPWSTARRISMRNCYGDHLQGLFNWAMIDDKATGLIGEDVTIENSLFVRIGGQIFNDGTTDIYSGGVHQGHSNNKVRWRHTTIYNIGPYKTLFEYGTPGKDWVFEDNILSMTGGSFCENGDTWTKCFTTPSVKGNVITHVRESDAGMWPTGNTIVPTYGDIGFVNFNGPKIEDWALAATSRLKGKASDGKDVGVDTAQLIAAIGGTFTSPTPTPTSTPQPSPLPSATPVSPPSPQPTPVPSPPPFGTTVDIAGYVYVEQERAGGVPVRIVSEGNVVATTTSRATDGYFEFDKVPVGSLLSATGAADQVINRSDTYFVNIAAQPRPSPPPTTPTPTPVATPTPAPSTAITWQQIPNSPNWVLSVAWASRKLYAATRFDGIRVWDGSTWTSLNEGLGTIGDDWWNSLFVTPGGALLVTRGFGEEDHDVYRLEGGVWRPSTPVWQVAHYAVDRNNHVIRTNGRSMFRSTDDGRSFQTAGNFPSAAAHEWMMAVGVGANGVLYGAGHDTHEYYSTDNGATWKSLGAVGSGNENAIRFNASGQPVVTSWGGVDVHEGPLTSTKWVRGAGLPEATYQDVILLPDGRMLAHGDRIYISSNGGYNWTLSDAGIASGALNTPFGGQYPSILNPTLARGADGRVYLGVPNGSGLGVYRTNVTGPAPQPSPSPAPSPLPSPVPSPTITPSPLPTPSPSPEPQPSPAPQCTISAPPSITVNRNGSTTISVTVTNVTTTTQVQVIGSDGQVTVTPLLWPVGPTSGTRQFVVRVKRNSRVITFQSNCGAVSVRVNVT